MSIALCGKVVRAGEIPGQLCDGKKIRASLFIAPGYWIVSNSTGFIPCSGWGRFKTYLLIITMVEVMVLRVKPAFGQRMKEENIVNVALVSSRVLIFSLRISLLKETSFSSRIQLKILC